jgi:ribosome-associated toxin RatA of RatAB toxin-antitoxin module
VPEISRSALLPYPPLFIYDIVNGVEEYPEFLPWCGDARIERQDDTALQAAIQIRGAGLNQWFRTRNSMVPGESIEMQLVDGPFRKLHGKWEFKPLDNSGCKIELALDFEFKAGLARLISPAFTRIANTMVDSFCQRAHELHGKQDID